MFFLYNLHKIPSSSLKNFNFDDEIDTNELLSIGFNDLVGVDVLLPGRVRIILSKSSSEIILI